MLKPEIKLRVGQVWYATNGAGKEAWCIVDISRKYVTAGCLLMEHDDFPSSSLGLGFIWKLPRKVANKKFPSHWTLVC